MCAFFSFFGIEFLHTFVRARSLARSLLLTLHLFQPDFAGIQLVYLLVSLLFRIRITFSLFFWGLQLLSILFRSFCDSSFLLFGGGGGGGGDGGVIGGQKCVIYSVNRKRLFATVCAIK